MAPLPPPQSGRTEPCENCEKTQFLKFSCADCGLGYCEDCWFKAKVHGPGRTNSNGVPHERLNREVAERLNKIFTTPSDPTEQRKLHETDADTIWFGVIRNVTGPPVLQDYGRYAKLMQESSTGEYRERWPQLVSFVGQTGAGKSTLVKTLVEYQRNLRMRNDDEFPTPVVGSINDHAPTSGDVHLYADPYTYLSQHPALYADCEGMDGGEKIPIGAPRKDYTPSKPTNGKLPMKIRKLPKAVRREMVWANNPEKCKREFAVKNLYPRLLYAFSDIVVFVLRNDRIFESAVLVPMLQWAAASIEGSVNQSAMPHAIIVLNFTDPSIDPRGWTTSSATDSLLNTYSTAVWDNADVKTHAKYWLDRGTSINTTKDLLLCYYSTVNVVRMPQKGRYALVDQQVVELNSQIQQKCADARENRKRLRVTYNSEEFQTALSMGFDHFSKCLDEPFDFIALSWNLNPIPKDFGGNILRLALSIKDDPMMGNATGNEIFQRLGPMVASCIMLDFVRHKLKGTASRLIWHYEECYKRALKEFFDDWWPCSFKNTRGRCVNTLRGHAKGHQDVKGRILASGKYQNTVSFNENEYTSEWHATIESNLEQTRERMDTMRRGDRAMEEEAAATELHLIRMNEFYSRLGSLSAYTNHSACFSCLRELPQHPLPCGHVLCTNCVRSFARKKSDITYLMDYCPLHEAQRWDRPWEIHVKPHLAGVRVLALDGGGMRAIIQVQVLQEIQRHLGSIPIARFFDLIVGTSTGGIIALGVGVEKWSLEKCEKNLEDLIFKAFAARELNGYPILESISTLKHKGKFKTKYFVGGLKNFFGDAQLFGGISDHDRYQRKVAVVSTTEAGQKPVIMTNYNRPSPDVDNNIKGVDYHFERPEKGDAELKIWEVCRATTAAASYFKPFINTRTGINYIDGGLYYSNPIRIANEERKLLWPDVRNKPPDLMLSIGTACQVESKEPLEGFLLKHKPKMFQTALNRFDNTADAQKTWDQFLQEVRLPNSSTNSRYVRLNPKLKKLPKFDDTPEFHNLIHVTKAVLKSPEWTSYVKSPFSFGTLSENRAFERRLLIHESKLQLPSSTDNRQFSRYLLNFMLTLRRLTRKLAHRLIASSFYFEKDTNPTDGNIVQGYIQCRFPDDSLELEGLGRQLQDLQSYYFSPYFIISEQYQDRDSVMVEIPADTVAGMIRERAFSMEIIQICLSSKVARTMISLCLRKDEETLPISGFPRHLMTEEQNIAPPSFSKGKGKRASKTIKREVTGNDEETNMTDTSSEHIPSWARGNQSPENASIAELADTPMKGTPAPARIAPPSPPENGASRLAGLFKSGNNSHPKTPEDGSFERRTTRLSKSSSKHLKQSRHSLELEHEDDTKAIPNALRVSQPSQMHSFSNGHEPESGSGASSSGTTSRQRSSRPHRITENSGSSYQAYSSPQETQSPTSGHNSRGSAQGRPRRATSPTLDQNGVTYATRLREIRAQSRTSNVQPPFSTTDSSSGPSGLRRSTTNSASISEEQSIALSISENGASSRPGPISPSGAVSHKNNSSFQARPKPPVPSKKPFLMKKSTVARTDDELFLENISPTTNTSSSNPPNHPTVPPRPKQRHRGSSVFQDGMNRQTVDSFLGLDTDVRPPFQANTAQRNANGQTLYMHGNVPLNIPAPAGSPTVTYREDMSEEEALKLAIAESLKSY